MAAVYLYILFAAAVILLGVPYAIIEYFFI